MNAGKPEPVADPEADKGSERRCIATGAVGDPEAMLRFVVAPSGEVVPDLARKLPGRGIWVTADRNALGEAVKRKLFARAARAQVTVPPDLVDRVEDLLVRRAFEALGFARRAGELVMGHGKTAEAIATGRVALVLEASDGSEDGRLKLRRLWLAKRGRELDETEYQTITSLRSAEMGLAFGRTNVIHAALFTGRMERRVRADLSKLGRFGRSMAPIDAGHARHDRSDEGTK